MRVEDLQTYPPGAVRHFKSAGYWHEETLLEWLHRHAATRPGAQALVQDDCTVSYGELSGAVDAMAGGLARLGIGAGDVVAVQLPNVIEWVVALLAVNRLGAVTQTVHMPYRGAELEYLLGHSGARAVICVDAFRDYPTAEVLLELARRLPRLEHVIVHGAAPAGTIALDDLSAGAGVDNLAFPAPSAPSLMLYTSGTTSSPKAIAVNGYPYAGNARCAIAEFGVTAADVILSPAPFSHLYGLCALQLALYAGATSLLLRSFEPQAFVDLVAAGRATILFTGPAHHQACRQAGLYEGADLASVRLTVISGAACPPELAEHIDNRLPAGKVVQLWGMTELQAGTYNRPDDPAVKRFTTAGRPAPGNEIRVVDELGAALPADTEGELQIRGASVFPGYFNNPAANAESFADGWFRTGDLARIDAEGFLTLTGRTKDIINRGGVKFNPADIETLIDAMAQVALCAIVPVSDAVLGEKACVFVQLAEGAQLTLADITAHLDAHQVAKNKWPEQLEIIDAMPLTPTRKVMKAQLQPGRMAG